MPQTRVPLAGPADLRWERADAARPQGALFDEVQREIGRGEFRGMEFLHVRAQRIINELKGGVGYLPFRHTINAYRGCSHACSFCFARPTHEYLGLDIGRDFEQRIVVKVNAAERLRAELRPSRWSGDLIAMGTNTDPYQRCEGKYRLTRSLVEVLAEHRNPFSILTKSTLILRDLDLLVEASARTDVRVNLSIGTLDEEVWKATEPGTPSPLRRLEAVATLNAAGISCGVLIAPILPGLSDGADQLRAVAKAVVDAGAVSVSTVVLHLRPGVKEHYLAALAETHPHLVERMQAMYPKVNAPKADRQRVSRIVHEAVRAAGGVNADGMAPEHLVGPATAVPEPSRRQGPNEQLALGI